MIVLVLYLLFLKGTFVSSIDNFLTGLESFVTSEQIEMLVNGLLLTGVIGSALVTVPYNCLQIIVKDREQNVEYDILATPLKRGQIIVSYFLAAAVSAFLVSGCILTAGLLSLSVMGDLCMNVVAIAKAYGVALLGAVSATAFFMPVMLLFRSVSASSAFFGILSAAAGFLIGAYIPISQFSDSVQTVCNIFPASHITILMRNLILQGILDDISASIGGRDNGMFLIGIQDTFSFRARLLGTDLAVPAMFVYVGILAVICIGIVVLVYGKTYKRK